MIKFLISVTEILAILISADERRVSVTPGAISMCRYMKATSNVRFKESVNAVESEFYISIYDLSFLKNEK